MVVFEKLTSCKGAKIEIHFEGEEGIKNHLQNNYSQNELQRKLRNQIDHKGVDTGKGTVVHVLINDQGIGKPMEEVEYADWQSKENKDWFHRSQHPLDELLHLMLIADMFGGHFGIPTGILMMNDLFGDIGDNKFVGPTKEEMDEIFSDPSNMDKIMAMKKDDHSHDCKFCLIPIGICPKRDSSFNYEELKTVLAVF
ncbi:MAG: hypothetical protein WCT51_03945 [Candidatus Shapirobacteria bacterium]|jgi:hypothetical protein